MHRKVFSVFLSVLLQALILFLLIHGSAIPTSEPGQMLELPDGSWVDCTNYFRALLGPEIEQLYADSLLNAILTPHGWSKQNWQFELSRVKVRCAATHQDGARIKQHILGSVQSALPNTVHAEVVWDRGSMPYIIIYQSLFTYSHGRQELISHLGHELFHVVTRLDDVEIFSRFSHAGLFRPTSGTEEISKWFDRKLRTRYRRDESPAVRVTSAKGR